MYEEIYFGKMLLKQHGFGTFDPSDLDHSFFMRYVYVSKQTKSVTPKQRVVCM